jgi:HEAT repeat protein
VQVKKAVAKALGEIGDQRAVESLIEALSDSSVNDAAAEALGAIGDERAVEPLIEALNSSAPGRLRLSQAIAVALGKIRDERAVAPLIRAFSSDAHEAAVKALIQFGDRAIPLLITSLNENEKIRKGSAEVLGKLQWKPENSDQQVAWAIAMNNSGDLVKEGSAVVEPLIRTLERKDTPLDARKISVNLLGEIGDQRAVAPLIGALGENDSSVRQDAANALGKIRDSRAVESLIDTLNHSDRYSCQAAIRALGAIGDERAVEPLITIFKNPSNPVHAAAEALGRIGDVRAVGPLIEALSQSERNGSRSAAEALGMIGDSRAVEPLISAMREHCDKYTRKAAAEALSMLQWEPTNAEQRVTWAIAKENWTEAANEGDAAIDPLMSVLKSGDQLLALGASEALGKIAGEQAIKRLIDMFTDSDFMVPKFAVDALAEAGKPAIEPLIIALKRSEFRIIEHAAHALGKIGDLIAIDPLIDAMMNNRDRDSIVLEPLIGALGNIGGRRSVEFLTAVIENGTPIESDTKTPKGRLIRKAIDEALMNIRTNGKSQLEGSHSDLSITLKDEFCPANIHFANSERIQAFGADAVPLMIQMFRNPQAEIGVYNQASILNEIINFALNGDGTADSFIRDIATGKIPVTDDVNGATSVRLAQQFSGSSK